MSTNKLATLAAGALALTAIAVAPAFGQATYPETTTVATDQSFADLVDGLKAAIDANGMGLVTQACASCGAAKRDVIIPGNMVLGVYRNDFAVRMLEASIPAGYEAPIRFYVVEGADGTASLSYRMPSAVFAPYGSADLDAMATEMDQIWSKIIDDAVGK